MDHLLVLGESDISYIHSIEPKGGWKPIVFAPGRFQPPHEGHEFMIKELVKFARSKKAEPIIMIISGSKGSDKNPLSGDIRKRYLQKIFKGARVMIAHNPFKGVEDLYQIGMKPIGVVAGSDRAKGYLGISKYYDIPELEIKSLNRDPDAEGISGLSATKIREFARLGDLEKFKSGMSKRLPSKDQARLYLDLRKELKKYGIPLEGE